MRLRAAIAASILSLCHQAHASGYTLIRSDLPLWSESDEGVWPVSVMTEGSFGMASIFSQGDWKVEETDCTSRDADDCATWMSLQITSVFHPRFSFREALTREALKHTESEISVLVDLDQKSKGAKIFALQIGFRGGSRYMLVSASSETTPIKQMTLLDARCLTGQPGVERRKAAFSSIYLTDYCSVSSKVALRSIAHDALRRAPLGRLSWQAGNPAAED